MREMKHMARNCIYDACVVVAMSMPGVFLHTHTPHTPPAGLCMHEISPELRGLLSVAGR